LFAGRRGNVEREKNALQLGSTRNHPDEGTEAMKSLSRLLAVAGVSTVLAFSVAAQAQQNFDSAKFFEMLQSKGISSKGLDSAKFFEELRSKGVNSSNKIDSKAFFEQLRSKGVNVPANFDGRKFFEDLKKAGANAPDMVDTTK
jgi:hypothetical protein